MLIRLPFYLVCIVLLSSSLAFLKRYEPPIQVEVDPGGFQDRVIATVNLLRDDAHLTSLETSSQLQGSIFQYVNGGRLAKDSLHGVFDHVENSIPQIHELAANLVYARTETELVDELSMWNDLEYDKHSHLATWIFKDDEKRMLGCLAVLARELPTLELPVKAEGFNAFFDQCKFCHKGHGVSLAKQSQNTLIITCPNCKKPYNLIATDSSGSWRRANQFFQETKAETVKTDMSEMAKLMTIWKEVSAKCRYQLDAKRIYGGDSWDFPKETLKAGFGDCEDTSLLLVDMLTSHGIESRVALGKHKGTGHAWVVAKVKDKQYILESTWDNVTQLRKPPTMDEIAFEYSPEYQFDRLSLYFNRYEGWTADYWAEDRWNEVNHEEPKTKVAEVDQGQDSAS